MSLTIKPNTTVVTLLQGDDLDPINERAETVQRTVKATIGNRRVGDGPDEVDDTVKEYDGYVDEAVERAVKVRMMQLPRKWYKAIRNEHPVRMVDSEEGLVIHHQDVGWGFNRETFGEVVVPPCIELGLLDPDDEDGRRALTARMTEGTYKPSAEVVEFVDSLSDGWFTKLYSAAVSLNQGVGPDTKVRLSSRLPQTSDEISDSHARLA